MLHHAGDAGERRGLNGRPVWYNMLFARARDVSGLPCFGYAGVPGRKIRPSSPGPGVPDVDHNYLRYVNPCAGGAATAHRTACSISFTVAPIPDQNSGLSSSVHGILSGSCAIRPPDGVVTICRALRPADHTTTTEVALVPPRDLG